MKILPTRIHLKSFRPSFRVVFSPLALLLPALLSLLLVQTEEGYSQILYPGDPMEIYLRLLQDDLPDGEYPSFNLRPLNSDAFLEGEGRRPAMHPWQDQPFFRSDSPIGYPSVSPSVRPSSEAGTGTEVGAEPGLGPGPGTGTETEGEPGDRLLPSGSQDAGSSSERGKGAEEAEARGNQTESQSGSATDTLRHQVIAGETLFAISRRYAVTVEEVMEWNNLETFNITIGQELLILPGLPPDASTGQLPQDAWPVLYPEGDPDEEGLDADRSGAEGTDTANSDRMAGSAQPATGRLLFPDIPWLDSFELYTPLWTTTYNNNIPLGQNDGALWQGKGLNTSLSFGGLITMGRFKASIRPEIVTSRNQEFELTPWPQPEGVSDYGYSLSSIDYPQRFGDEPFIKLDPGQSWIRYDHSGLSAGVSTANLWTGPALHNPIVFSNNAPGFLHLFLETERPLSTPVGNIEGKLLWGRLQESDYFDSDSGNDTRFINSLIVNYSPSFVEGLHLGFTRTFVKPALNGEVFFSDFFTAFRSMSGETAADGTVDADQLQMVSLFGRWRVPGYGFEFYGEWSRNTPSEDVRDFMLEPEFSRAYVLGFLKRFTLSSTRWLTLNYEMTHLESPRLAEFRESESYYLSSAVAQGYTHKGQVIGAGIGPGSNSQHVGVNIIDKWGMAGLSFSRVVHDIERLYRNHEIIGKRPLHTFNPRELNEVEFRYGAKGILFLPYGLELQAAINRSKFYQFRHQYRNGRGIRGYNTNLQFTVRYNLPGALR